MHKNDSLNWEWLCRIAAEEPNKEHTVLQTPDMVSEHPAYATYAYGDTIPTDACGSTLLSYRDKAGRLMVTKMRKRTHELNIGASGSGKTQGKILNEALNMDGRTSYIFTDPKGEVTPRAYSYAVEKYGKENVIILNYMQPEYSMAQLNPLSVLAEQWLSAERLPKGKRKAIRDNVITELSKFLESAFVVQSVKDPTWEITARNFIFAIIMGLFEDLTIPAGSKKIRRPRTTPDQITFDAVHRIFNSFSWDNRFNDRGFFTSRDPETSLAYQISKPVRTNAANTRANYMQFVENFLAQYDDPKIRDMSRGNTFAIESLATTPRVIFIIYDLSNVKVREWVNNIISHSLQALLAYSHKTARALDVPVIFVCDEFPTLKPHDIYPTVLETGRGSNLFMILVVQSLSQLAARYEKSHLSMVQNCSVQSFLGTNDIETARTFSASLGKTTIPSASAFLAGQYTSQEVPVVTVDALMHRMDYGESYISVDRQMPIHGGFTLYYETPEYLAYPIVETTSHQPLAVFESQDYRTTWLYKDEEDDDDDFKF